MEPIEISRARAAYNAYNAGGDPATANKNYRGESCPEWDDLPQNVRDKWIAATAPEAEVLANACGWRDAALNEWRRHYPCPRGCAPTAAVPDGGIPYAICPVCYNEARKPTESSVTIARAIELLNELIALDEDAVTALFENRVPCNEALADHPTVQIVVNAENKYTVGLLGIINGMFGVDGRGIGQIGAAYSDETGKVLYCMRRIAAV